jgi:WD repeat-containing protein 68
MNQQGQQYTPARRTGGYNDELHMGGSSSISQHSQLPSTGAPQIKLDQASPGHQPQLQSYQSSSAVPGVLQPGRPSVMSSNTASTVPTMQQAEYKPEYATPSKPTLSTHSYSRSSPAANPYDGTSYVPYTPTTPNTGLSSQQFMTPSENKYASSGQRNVSNTPLGLADIRPRADSSLSEGLPGSMQYELANGQPGTSNYLAPWASYAFDWCKWAPQGNSSGKLAIGSYLEDGHNFVRVIAVGSHGSSLSAGALTCSRLRM